MALYIDHRTTFRTHARHDRPESKRPASSLRPARKAPRRIQAFGQAPHRGLAH